MQVGQRSGPGAGGYQGRPLTRIIADRSVGAVFFGNYHLMDYELMGGDGRAAIIAEAPKFGLKPFLPPQVPFGSHGLGGIAIARRRLVGEAAAEEIRAIDAAGFGDRRHPAVPEEGVAGEAVHHQHRRRGVPRPPEIIDSAMDGSTFWQGNARHRQLLRTSTSNAMAP